MKMNFSMRFTIRENRGNEYKWLIPFFLLALIIQFSCREKIIEPPELGKRDYNWSIDTLSYTGSFQTILLNIWAESPRNVYLVGYNDRSKGQIYHYNGEQWDPIELPSFEGGLDFYDIDGTSGENLWVVGERITHDIINDKFIFSGCVIHFDGEKWTDVSPDSTDILRCVWVISSNELWIGGEKGAVYRYSNMQWFKYTFNQIYSFTSIVGLTDREIYLIGSTKDYTPPTDSSGYFLFHYNGQDWSKIDSVSTNPLSPPCHFGYNLYNFNNSLYSSGVGLFKYVNKSWISIYDGPARNISMAGENHIFAVGKSIYHYNGHDWFEFIQFQSNEWPWFGCYTNSEEVFVVSTDYNKSYVLHGK